MIHNTKVSIIAAIGKNRELGKDNKLLFKISEDMKRFKELTKGHPIIMGRKTWDSLPFKPLPGRFNIIITRDKTFNPHKNQNHHKSSNCKICEGLGCAVSNSIEEAIEIAKRHSGEDSERSVEDDSRIDFGQAVRRPELTAEWARMTKESINEIFILGGGQIYKEAIEKDLVDKLYLTAVDASADADTFFPDYSMFKTIISEENRESSGYKYKFFVLER